MDPTVSRSLRDRLIAVAAFAYAFSYLYTTGFYLWTNTQRTYWDLGAWAVAAGLLATAYAFGQCYGFIVIGGAFLGDWSSRAHRVRIGAYWVAAAYLLACSASLMGYRYAYRAETMDWHVHATVIATSLSYFAGAATAFVLARAYGKASADRKRVLGWASVWFIGYAGFAVLAGVVVASQSELGAQYALYIAAHALLLLGAVAAALAFFGYRRSPGWIREARYARLLLVSTSTVTLFTVMMFSRNLIGNLHDLRFAPSYWNPWLSVLASVSQMLAGVCLCLAFVVVYRAVPRPLKPEPSERWEATLPECPTCGGPYDPTEYRDDAPAWLCVRCGSDLRLV